MKMLNNFLKKFNNPVPVFAQTKMEKETQNEDASSTKPKTTFIDVAGLDEVKEEPTIEEGISEENGIIEDASEQGEDVEPVE